ncbi:MAG: site-specific integrase [Planctomycetota bacterium]|nr:site-specific integrase [Planctomycetota bacterium]
MPRQPKLRQKNGHWYTAANGGLYFGKVGHVSHADAKRLFASHLARPVGDLTASSGEAVSLGELCDRFLIWVSEKRGTRTFDDRERHLTRLCAFKEAKGLAASDFTLTDLNDFQAFIKTTFKADDFTCDKHATSVKAAFAWGKRHELIPADFNAFVNHEKYKVSPQPVSAEILPTSKEITAIKASVDSRFSPLFKVYHATGARTSELLNARVQDFQNSIKSIVLKTEKRSAKMKEPISRTIILNPDALAIVSIACQNKSPDDFIFTDEKGNPFSRFQAAYYMRRAVEKAGARDHLDIYSFRHLWISEALMSGVRMPEIARMAGTSIAMIEKVYGHISNSHLQDAAAKISEYRQANITG